MQNKNSSIIIAVVIASIFLLSVLSPIYFVQSGEKAVIKRFGVISQNTVNEGMRFKTPLIDEVITVNVRPQTVEGEAPTYTKDNQPIDISFKIIYSIPEAEAANSVILYRGEPLERFASPKIIDAIKAVGGKYTATEFVTQREIIRKAIVTLAKEAVINDDTKTRAITIIDIPITNVDFDDQYEQAIKAKQVMQQKAQQKEYELQAAKRDAEIVVAKAKAEAEALTITAYAIAKNPSIVKLEEVKKWDGHYPLNAKVIGGGATIVDTK